MTYWILTEYNFQGIANQEQKYIDFIILLQDFYDYFFDVYHLPIPESKIAYTATNLNSLKSEMSGYTKVKYIELIEKLFIDKFGISKNQVLSFKLVSDKELIKIFPETFDNGSK